MSCHDISVTVNGKAYAASVDARITLLDFLRTQLALTGTHVGCEHGVCGACSILYEGTPMRACSLLAVQANGKKITTVEGLCNEDGTPGILQDAFRDGHAMQCGYCIPGTVVTVKALLDRKSNPDPSDIEEALSRNLCRCGCHHDVLKAVERLISESA